MCHFEDVFWRRPQATGLSQGAVQIEAPCRGLRGLFGPPPNTARLLVPMRADVITRNSQNR